jgi:hypothetical protein
MRRATATMSAPTTNPNELRENVKQQVSDMSVKRRDYLCACLPPAPARKAKTGRERATRTRLRR